MRRLFKKLLEILDGTPAVYGKRQRGQSMVELALVTPLLIILLAGLAEIGYFAQNYLNLIEVTRVGARTGTVQQGSTDPLRWDPLATAPPIDLNGVAAIRNCDPSDERAYLGFYNFLSCIMIRSMDPMPFRDPIALIASTGSVPPPEVPAPNGIDDIVISAFAVQTVIPNSLNASLRNAVDWPLNDTSLVIDGNTPSDDIPQTVIVGRYPTNANRCTEIGERDPFDWITDGDLTTVVTADGPQYLELREITIQGNPVDPPELRGSGAESTPRHDNQRGYMWNGQHLVSGTTGCFGSEWSIKRVEQLINLQGFNLQDGSAFWSGDLRTYVPSQGIILVELHWRHETLSQYVGLGAALSPVFAILGEEVTMSVWSAFPLPTVEPRIKFPS